eukprot:CAMPEP_0119359542 /NCGR_PEP_ID=MMETSP1334-20130426/7411_1 /TAXON_ID=127549 /ORGANISM="Calcidiscus leptoporus, Strain RCC1130" /LENGTH=159 /DNA_ID=CAMNT_0007374239 /DNA_START=278 /DNA_END=754 /DNA_ORIENTATION=+
MHILIAVRNQHRAATARASRRSSPTSSPRRSLAATADAGSAQRSVVVGEALAKSLVDALRLAQPAQESAGRRRGVLAIGRLAREEEPGANRPRELIVVSARSVCGDVAVRAKREGVLAPLAHHRATKLALHLTAEGAAERLERRVDDALVGEPPPRRLG